MTLMLLRNSINEQYQILEKRTKKDGLPLQFALSFVLESKQNKERQIIEKLGDDMLDFFKTNSISFETFDQNKQNKKFANVDVVSFRFKATYLSQELEIPIKIYSSTQEKLDAICRKLIPETNSAPLKSLE